MKKFFALLIAICTLVTFCLPTFAAQETNNVFKDVDASTDAGKAIYKLYNAGIVNGNGDGTYTPANPVTRAELCKMVNNIKGFKEIDNTSFSDVTPDKWYYTHVIIGKKAGYINGFPDGTFRGDEYITREQVFAVICRAFGIYDLGITADISDEVSDWARPYANMLLANKLITLEAGNTLRATQNMRRDELSVALAQFVKDPAVQPTVTPGGSTSSGGSVIVGGGSSSGGGSSRPSGGGSSGGGGSSKPSKPIEPETPDEPETPENPDTPETPEEPKPMTKEEIIAANQEVLIYLKAVHSDITGARFRGTTKDICDIVSECVAEAIKVGESGEQLISKEFVYEEYADRISDAKNIYYALSEEAQAQVIDTISQNVGQTTQDYLIMVFL